ncbi:putative dsRNA-binding protein, partial [Patescibacteria group bacterium]|nr:putative dsRNA-binding protein [Patescibacteria group bacterium]
SLLQEKIQAQTSQSPVYKTIKEEGPEHNKIFTVSVTVTAWGEILATGVEKSKQKAEEEAAKQALEKIGSKK